MMKSIASMLFVLAAALLVSSPALAGYADGMNQYAAYHVVRGGVDPMGTDSAELTADVNPNHTRHLQNVAWQMDIPQSTLQCEQDETLVYEFKASWSILGKFTAVETESGTNTGQGNYHVTFEDWLDNFRGPHNVHIASGIGRFRGKGYYKTEFYKFFYPGVNFQQLDRDELRRIQAEAEEYAQDKSNYILEQRNIANTSGDFSYKANAHCVCTKDLEWNDKMANIPGPGTRGESEFATMNEGPTRFRTGAQQDLRNFSRWILGSPRTDAVKKSEVLSEGGFRYNFGDLPSNDDIQVY